MAKCGLCGVDVTFDMMQYSVPDFEGKKHRVCKNCAVSAQDKALKYDPASGRIVVVEKSEIEIRKKCNVCGNVFCYNPVDLDNNKKKQNQAMWSAVGSLGGAMSGHYAASAINQSNANQAMNGIVDYNKCPQCGSMDLRVISKEELAAAMNSGHSQQPVAPQISAADELKKYKELLDLGVISQEEFDVKKNELLHGVTPAVPQPAPTVTVSQPTAPVAPVQTAPIAQNESYTSKKPSKLPAILFWIATIMGIVRGFRDVYYSTLAFTVPYRGRFCAIVGSRAWVSGILAAIIWIALSLFVGFVVKKIATKIESKK